MQRERESVRSPMYGIHSEANTHLNSGQFRLNPRAPLQRRMAPLGVTAVRMLNMRGAYVHTHLTKVTKTRNHVQCSYIQPNDDNNNKKNLLDERAVFLNKFILSFLFFSFRWLLFFFLLLLLFWLQYAYLHTIIFGSTTS